MEGKVSKVTRHPVMKLMVDFDNLGFDRRDEWIDITDDILDISGSKEKSGKQIGSVTSDIATFTADNTENTFSNDNVNSPLSGKIKPNLKFRLLTGFQGEALVPYASGYIDSFTPSWRDKRILIKTSDYFKLFKKTDVPEDSFQDVSWDELVNILCDHVGLPAFIVRNIPKTEFHYSYFKFEQDNCFEALKALMEIAVGEAYFENEQLFVKTKLALDYQLDQTVDHEITVDDMFSFEENVDGENIINSVEISSQYKTIAPMEVVFETPENLAKVENELSTYDGSGSVYANANNLPIYHAEDVPMQLTNITQRKNIRINGHDPNTGRVEIHPDSLVDAAQGDTMSLSYSYQQLALLAGKTRKYTFVLNQEVDSLGSLDIAVWDYAGNLRREFSDTPDAANTVSRQGMTFNKKTNTVTLTLKNNYDSATIISTMQLRGYPVKVISPIEVFVRDLPSVSEFGKKEISIQNNYLNNIRLAEKIGQYIVDNNKQDRKRISIEIGGFSEFSLDDISLVTEESSGTSHKFTNERIDYSFNPDNGWNLSASLLELDSTPWVYESFKGESWEKTDSGVPDSDFLKDINANLIKNGGAELYTGFSDYNDVAAISQKHIVPDYWRFVRSSGDATARIRDGGNLVLHGLHSFEITTSNSGAGYYEQVINGIKTDETYILSLVASMTASSGRASVLQYASGTLLQTDSIDIPSAGVYELMISSLTSTTDVVIQVEKFAGTTGSESFVFDKVKFENSKEKTPYIETEETTSVQVGQRYANSLLIGNQYGLEVIDDLNNTRVRIGQYEPNKYGIQVFGGAIEFMGDLPPQLQEEFDVLTSDVNSVKLEISADNITQKVMSTTTFNDALNSKADSDTVANEYATKSEVGDVEASIPNVVDEKIAAMDMSEFATKSELVQTSTDLTAKFEAGGGVNLLRNSTGTAGFDFWGTNTGERIQTTTNNTLEVLGFPTGFYFPEYTTAGNRYIWQDVNVEIGKTYTLSWYINKNNNAASDAGTGNSFVVQILDPEGVALSGASVWYHDATNGYERGTMTFAPSTDLIKVRVYGYAGAEATIAGLMLNLGANAFQWTMANGEVYNTNVQFDINGIKVLSFEDGKEVNRTVMTPEKFAGYYDANQDGVINTTNNSEDEVFKMDKDEFVMKKAVVKEEITMGQFKIINVNGGGKRGWAFVPIT